VITEHRFRKVDGGEGLVCIINVYCPRADQEREDRKAYKLWFCQMLQVRAEALLAQGRFVVKDNFIETLPKIQEREPQTVKKID
jgi:AP endonuclease 2